MKRSAFKRRVAAIVFVLLVIGAWHVTSLYMPPVLIPGPVRVFSRFMLIWTDTDFLSYALSTIIHVVAAVTAAFTAGVLIVLLAYRFPVVLQAVYSRLAPFLNSFSGIGWAFLSLIWLGVTDSAVVFAVAMALLPFAIINGGAGLAELDQDILEMTTSFSRSHWRKILFVVLPMLLPYLIATLRLCFAIAWHIVPTAELLSGSSGLGTLISVAKARYWTDMIFAVALLNVLMVFITDRVIFVAIQNRLGRAYGR